MQNSATELTHFCRIKSIALDLVLQKCVSSVAEFCIKPVFSCRVISIFLTHHTLVPLAICFFSGTFFVTNTLALKGIMCSSGGQSTIKGWPFAFYSIGQTPVI